MFLYLLAVSDFGQPRLSIEPYEEGRRTIRLRLVGELDMATVKSLRSLLEDHQGSGHAVVIDLSELSFIDSTGLQLLLRAQADARRDGWSMALDANVSDQVARVLELTSARALFDWA